MFTIRCDYREDRGGCVITRLQECRAAGLFVSPDQYEIIDEVLTTGDYVIQCAHCVLLIERKTWEDLSASIKDGRIFTNHKRMIDAAGAGCRIMYIIEGRAPDPDWSNQKVGGILVGNMMAKLDHFAMRDNVWLDFTRDARHTAARLIELGKHLITLAAQPFLTKDGDIKTLENANGIALVDGGAPIDVDAIVKKKHERSLMDGRRQMLMCITGIGEKIATLLLDGNKWADIITQQNCTIKSARVATELRELFAGNRQAVYIAMLSTIKGVSEKMATAIATAIPIGRIVIRDPATTSMIANIKLTEASRRLGDKLAEVIVSHWSDSPTIPQVSVQQSQVAASNLNTLSDTTVVNVQPVASN